MTTAITPTTLQLGEYPPGQAPLPSWNEDPAKRWKQSQRHSRFGERGRIRTCGPCLKSAVNLLILNNLNVQLTPCTTQQNRRDANKMSVWVPGGCLESGPNDKERWLVQNIRLYRIFCICGLRAGSNPASYAPPRPGRWSFLPGPGRPARPPPSCACFRDYAFVSLDLPTEAEQAEKEPGTFLQRHPPPVIIDEVQYAPGLFRHLKVVVDAHRSTQRSIPAHRFAEVHPDEECFRVVGRQRRHRGTGDPLLCRDSRGLAESRASKQSSCAAVSRSCTPTQTSIRWLFTIPISLRTLSAMYAP